MELYNIGTGKARAFKDLVKATFAALALNSEIKYIDMPEDIREKYQYFTEAKYEKTKSWLDIHHHFTIWKMELLIMSSNYLTTNQILLRLIRNFPQFRFHSFSLQNIRCKFA
ncbi:MAG: hypothetical protein WKF59_11585 [Chitinophagaceae bacterium]